MKFYIGIEGGGTKTNCSLIDENFAIVKTVQGNKTNFHSEGLEQVVDTCYSLITFLLKETNTSLSNINHIALALAGAGLEADQFSIQTKLSQRLNNSLLSISVTTDAFATLESCFDGDPGVLVIAGTGSIVFAKDDKNITHRVGGFGRLIGDEGSGYSLGKRLINVFSNQLDGRLSKTLLFENLSRILNVNSSSELIELIYKKNFEFASIVKELFQLADKGDEHCINIIHDEVNELAKHIFPLNKYFDDTTMSICLWGGLFENNYYKESFSAALTNEFNNFKIVSPVYKPAIGAIKLGLKAL